MKRLLASALCAASLLCAQTRLAPRPAAAQRPKLVVMIVVDQFRYDYLTRFRAEFTGGLKRLLDRGAVFTNAHYEHAPTVTAVGHSIVLSGAMPANSGIIGNEWLDRATGKQVTSVSDDSVDLLGVEGKKGASPHRLLVSTVGDELKMSGRAPAKVVGVSIKDRSAILPAGRMADGAYWFDKPSGRFVSSTWYFKQFPEWAAKFNDRKVVEKFKDGGSFDKTAEGKAGNDIVELFAEAAVEGENLGANGGTDVLAMSFSANDTVGHAKGPDSPEVHEITLHTDKVLARFFDFVDKRVGLSNTLFVLTADHGVAPMPEVMQSRRMPGGRMTEGAVLDAISRALNDRYGEAKWIAGKSAYAPYLDHKLIADSKLDLEEVQHTAAQAVRAVPHIARVFTREELRRGLAQSDMVGRRVQNGFFYQRASDLVIVAEPYWLFEKIGTSHGTPWNYDSHVPIVFMGARVKPGRYHGSAAVVDIAPTLSMLLDVEVPSGASGRVLTEMLAQ
ncbi:MAG: alkaline phosphatase family protein [Candidatus Solibacter usitatus]|nr:alkaline phosphatase family protein [Candidatus Solibacter usitatus]